MGDGCETFATRCGEHEAPDNNGPVLDVDGPRGRRFYRSGTVQALDGIGSELRRGETLALVGEKAVWGSGDLRTRSWESSIGARITSGRIVFGWPRPDQAARRARRDARGANWRSSSKTAYSTDPIRPVGRQIADILIPSRQCDRSTSAKARAVKKAGESATSPTRSGAPPPTPFEFRAGCVTGDDRNGAGHRAAMLIADRADGPVRITDEAVIMDLIRRARGAQQHGDPVIKHDLGLDYEIATRSR